MKVCIPATLRARTEETTTGWVVLRPGSTADQSGVVVAFCWSQSDAKIVWNALIKAEPGVGYWVSRAWMEWEGDDA